GKQLAVWMRRVCLGGAGGRSGEMPAPAPPLLRQLAALGNKLNQTARKGDNGGGAFGDRGQGGGALMGIGGEVRRLREGGRGQGG
ncbi:plasmid mobilization relaxosome protein MobC, partial [Escherichia coli]|uniref:plasmid mobilization relaxosome protein MobC n=1 Tax=Escherichia coli TaxID=562 RepID=UPI001FCED23C